MNAACSVAALASVPGWTPRVAQLPAAQVGEKLDLAPTSLALLNAVRSRSAWNSSVWLKSAAQLGALEKRS